MDTSDSESIKAEETELDYEIQALINALEKFKIFLNKEFTVRTDCEAIVKFIKNDQSKKVNNFLYLLRLL